MRVSFRLLAAGFATAVFACGGDDEPPPTGPMAVTVSHYDYQFDLESRAATSTLTLEVDQGGDCVTLPMRVPGPSGVTLGGEPLVSGSLEDDQLTVCGAGFFQGETIELQVSMTVPLETWEDTQVGYSVSTDLEGQPFYYLLDWVGECDRFGPCDPSPAHFATYRFTVTHPSGTQVLCPGVITAGDTQTVCDFAWPGGPSYSTFSFSASPSWVKHELGTTPSGVTVTLYDTPSSAVGDAIDVDQILAFITWMEDQFGPYPYGDQLRLATGPTAFLGFEHPGNVVLYDQLDTQNTAVYDKVDQTIKHEIAHMWAGNQTTLADLYDFSWKEAAAEYLSFVFENEQLESPIQSRVAASKWKLWAATDLYYPVPLDHPPLVEFSGTGYGPGPLTLFRHFEALYDRDTVMEAMADLLGQTRAIGVADVKDAMARATGADLDAYFDRWVYGEGPPSWPHFTVTVTDLGGGDVDVNVAQDAPDDGLYGCAFSLWLQNTDTDQQLEVWIDLGLAGVAEKTVSAHPGFTVNRTMFDPDTYCLANVPQLADRAALRPPWRAPTRPLPYPLQR